MLPTALTLGLILLLYANLLSTGFYLATTSLFLYAVLICAEAYQGPAEQGDWILGGLWLAFCDIDARHDILNNGNPANKQYLNADGTPKYPQRPVPAWMLHSLATQGRTRVQTRGNFALSPNNKLLRVCHTGCAHMRL